MIQYTMVYVTPDETMEDIDQPVMAIVGGDPDDAEDGMISGQLILPCDIYGNFLDVYGTGYVAEDGKWRSTLLEAEKDWICFVFNKMGA